MKEVIKKRNLILMIGIIFLLVTAGVFAGTYFLSPSGYISLDVNPGIEIQTNRLNQVVSVDPINEDAEQLMAGYDLRSRNLEDVLKDIVDRMILNEYLSPDKDNQILISSDDKNASAALSNNVNEIISAYLSEKQLDANLIRQSLAVTDADVQNAHNNNLSFGKMALIDELMNRDAGFTFEDLSGKRISDLVSLAESRNISLEVLMNQEDVGDEDFNDDPEDIDDIDDEDLDDDQDDINDIDNKIEDEEFNDDQEDINKVDDEDLDDDQDDINDIDNEVEDEEFNDDQEDINKVDGEDYDDEQDDIDDADHDSQRSGEIDAD